jgi:hypothetical protein
MDSMSWLRNLDGNRRGASLADPGDLTCYDVDMTKFTASPQSGAWITDKTVPDQKFTVGADLAAIIESCNELVKEGDAILRSVK